MKKLIFLFIILVIFISSWLVYSPKECCSGKEVVFYIEKGEGSKEISANLERQDFIWWGPMFRLYVLITGVSGNLQAGDYMISPSMNISELVNKFVLGDVVLNEITIIEGWNLRGIGFYFENKGMFQIEEVFELAGLPPSTEHLNLTELSISKDFSSDYDILNDKPKNVSLEGYLFPDTYELNKGASLEEVISKMLSNLEKKITLELREEVTKQEKTVFEILTMASLIEKEVITKEDKEIVSGILWKRLKTGMPLQVDATVSYLTGKQTTAILKAELKLDSPYNTYKYYGLPVGPISNPGLSSIEAAVYSKDSAYWYYLSTPEGETIFSKTLEEHNIAKYKYLK